MSSRRKRTNSNKDKSYKKIKLEINSYTNDVFRSIDVNRVLHLLFDVNKSIYVKSSYGHFTERKEFKMIRNIDNSIDIESKPAYASKYIKEVDRVDISGYEISISHLLDMFLDKKTKDIEKEFIKHFLFSHVFSISYIGWNGSKQSTDKLAIKLFGSVFKDIKSNESRFLKYDKDNMRILYPLYILINTMGVDANLIKETLLSFLPEDFKITLTHSNVKSTNFIDFETLYANDPKEALYLGVWNSIKNKKFCLNDISKMNDKRNIISMLDGTIRPVNKKTSDPRKCKEPIVISRAEFKTKMFHESIGL